MRRRIRYDALVLGAGPAGSATAALLARAGWTVGLVEQTCFPRPKVCGEFISATNDALWAQLGLEPRWASVAGPAVEKLRLFYSRYDLHAPMPASTPDAPWGHAWLRADLDARLLAHAKDCGVIVWQPWKAQAYQSTPDGVACQIRQRETSEHALLHAPVLIAAQGSWETGRLPGQSLKKATRDEDLLAFKTHFARHHLPRSHMALVIAPGLYGGMVGTTGDLLSVSCCIRRKTLRMLRAAQPLLSAGVAVETYLKASSKGIDRTLAGARREQAWLGAGPIRPGIRRSSDPRVFLVGNTAGEAHPLIAEGISMALQGAGILAAILGPARAGLADGARLQRLQRDYEHTWARAFGPRIHWSQWLAALALEPITPRVLLPGIAFCPNLLTHAARWVGKAQAYRGSLGLLSGSARAR